METNCDNQVTLSTLYMCIQYTVRFNPSLDNVRELKSIKHDHTQHRFPLAADNGKKLADVANTSLYYASIKEIGVR